jgi:hypothetical protein
LGLNGNALICRMAWALDLDRLRVLALGVPGVRHDLHSDLRPEGRGAEPPGGSLLDAECVHTGLRCRGRQLEHALVEGVQRSAVVAEDRLKVDLGQIMLVCQITLNRELARAKEFQIQVS